MKRKKKKKKRDKQTDFCRTQKAFAHSCYEDKHEFLVIYENLMDT